MSTVTEKIKSLCGSRQVQLEDLLSKAGVSMEHFEQVDKTGDIPPLSWLIKISRALKVRPGTFLDGYEEEGPIVNKKTDLSSSNAVAYHLNSNDSHLDFYSLGTGKAGRYFEPFIIEVNTNVKENPTLTSLEGEEFIYVLKGSVSVKYGIEEHILNEGDSMYYDSIVEHLITSADGNPAKLLAIVYSPL